MKDLFSLARKASFNDINFFYLRFDRVHDVSFLSKYYARSLTKEFSVYNGTIFFGP